VKSDPGGIMTAWAAAEAQPCTTVEIEWTSGSWTNETSRVVSWAIDTQMVNPLYGWLSLAGQPIGTAQIVVVNDDGRYSQSRSGSQANTYGIRGKRVRIRAGYVIGGTATYPAGYEWVGRIMDVPEAETEGTVSLSCQDMLSDAKTRFLSTKVNNSSTYLPEGLSPADWITTLAGLVGLSVSSKTDTGLMRIPYCWLDESEVLRDMRDCAASEGGALFCDNDGSVVFWNMAHWAGQTRADYGSVILGLSSYAELLPKRDYESEYNIIASEYTPMRYGKPTTVYSLKQYISVPPSGSVSQTLNFQWPILAFVSYTLNACTAGGVSSSINVSPSSPQYAKRWDVTFSNSDTLNEVYITQFDVLAYPIDKRPAAQYIRDLSSGKPYPRRYQLPNTQYVQTQEQVELLCDMLADRMSTVRLQAQARQVNGNPLFELGDIIGVTSSLTGLNEDFILVGKHSKFGDGDYVMDLDLFALAGLYQYSNYFKVGTSTLGATSDVVLY